MGRSGVIRLKYVHAFRDRFGRMRYYFRRHGMRTALPGLPGSTEFMEVYAAALASAPKDATLGSKAAPGTFDALALRYFGSAQYLTLSATSRTNYRRVIEGFLKEHGHRLVRQMTREHVDIIVGKMANKPGAGIPPGQTLCPYHYESEEEWLLVLQGEVTLRHPEGEDVLGPGDVTAFPVGPAGAHQTTNNGTETVRMMMFANSDPIGYCVYPDSNKIAYWTNSSATRRTTPVIRREESVGYYDGEPLK